jgi:hypothetical protein
LVGDVSLIPILLFVAALAAAREIGWADTPFGPIAALSKIPARTERCLARIYFGGAASAMSAMTGR